MQKLFKDKVILVTGGTGSLGQQLIKRLLYYSPKRIRILSRDESKQFYMEEEFKDHKNLRFLIGDIRDKERLRKSMENVDIVFHAAALKHVKSCEYNPFETVKTNIIGVQNVIECAIENDVENVVYTSSDKATNPSNAMGVSKLMGEKLMISGNYYRGDHNIRFSSVRFGNVIGSNGSVIDLWKKQIEKNREITVTEPDMMRYILPNAKAVDLVLKAATINKGGEVFLFKMPAVKLKDLADAFVEKYTAKLGINPNSIKRKIIGLKPGEKMYEELMTEEESYRCLETDDMYIILPQIKELFVKNHEFAFSNAKKAGKRQYTSDDTKLLTKKQIKSILTEENLL